MAFRFFCGVSYQGVHAFFFFSFFLNIYSFLGDSQGVSGGGAEREETQNWKQAPVSELSAQSQLGA